LNNNKLINPKLICAFCWFVLFFNYENARSKNKNKKNTTIFYYLTYQRQVLVIRPSSGHLYIKFKTGYM